VHKTMITLTREEAQSVLDAMIPYQQKVIATTKEYGVTVSVNNEIETAIEILRARLSAPEPNIVQDAIVYGTGITMGGNRIDPASIYKEPEPPCKTGSQCIGGKCPQCVVSEPVAWMNEGDIGKTDWKVWAHGKPTATMPLYAVLPHPEPAQKWKYDPMTGEPLIDGWPLYSGLPKPWQGLTDEEIKSLLWETRVDNLKFARVIEKLLREKNAS